MQVRPMRLALASAAAMVLIADAAKATIVVPAATVDMSAGAALPVHQSSNDWSNTINLADSGSVCTNDGQIAGPSSAQFVGYPSVIMNATAGSSSVCGASAGVTFSFLFEIESKTNSPAPSVPISLLVKGNVGGVQSATPSSGEARADFVLRDGGTGPAIGNTQEFYCANAQLHFPVPGADVTQTCGAVSSPIHKLYGVTELLLPNHLYSVTEQIYAHAARPGESYTAVLDPEISFDPSFADAANYAIVLSPGVGNGVVPLPPAAALFMSALVPLARIRRRGVG